jgi:drug/metabolite transporter (DMT)-like permease
MSLLIAGLIVFLAPLLVAVAAGLVLPEQIRLYGVIAAYLLASVVSVSVAAEQYHGRIRSRGDLLIAARSGTQGALWIGLAVGGVIAAAWLASRLV